MRKRFFFGLVCCVVLSVLIFPSYSWSMDGAVSSPVNIAPPNNIQIVGSKLYLNGQPFEMKFVGYGSLRQNEFPSQWGICTCDRQQYATWGPNPFNCPGGVKEFDMGRPRIDYDLSLIQGIDANGIRTWEQVNQDLLDSAAQRGLMVAAGLELPWSDQYGQTAFEQGIINTIITHVRQYKYHPALLAWIMGNEIEINIPSQTVPAYFAFLERLAQAIKAEDPLHPVTTAVAGIGSIQTYDPVVPTMDFWSANIYFNPANPGWPAAYAGYSNKPLFVSEFGADAFRHTGNIFDDFSTGTEDLTWHANINGQMTQFIRQEVARNYSNVPGAKTIGGAYFLFVDQDWQPRGWADACYHGIDQDGWHGPNDYQDIEFFGIYKNAPTTSIPYAVTPRPLANTLKNIW